jgi:site-specific DNA recombinase
MAGVRPIRCAIYTRKSSEEGLDQAFNSLHAQRDACEAYIKSQAQEGWRALPALYDDGGISGATMERPALQRLLQDVDRGLVDTIVVYKIDRLTRSLADFARIVERLEAAGASFVSVTQAFNTTTSMGRLTLNVLLSFAQFEREVTGERIRDKIAASKKKGMWMGGALPLGYDAPTDPQTRALVVNEAEAETVRSIFQTYLELGSVAALSSQLQAQGILSKVSVARSGARRGGEHFSRGALYHLLQNRTYLGEVPHRDQSYPGAHPAIVPLALFDAVQARIASQRRVRRERPTRSDQMPLKGLLFDADGEPMSPSFGYGRRGQMYRYYVSAPLQQGRKPKGSADALRRISAPALEERLRSELSRLLGEDAGLTELLRPVRRVELDGEGLRMVFALKDAPRSLRSRLQVCISDPALGELYLAVSCRVRGGRTWVLAADGGPAFSRRDPVLIRRLRQAHRIAALIGWQMADGALSGLSEGAPAGAYERRLCRLVFLAPDIQRAILAGRQPPGLTLEGILRADFPLEWAKQRRQWGFAPAALPDLYPSVR